MSRFAVFDIDGTLIRWQLFHAIVHHLGKHGFIDAADHEAIKAARMTWKNRSNPNAYKHYEQVLVDTYIGSLHHISPSDYRMIVDEVFNEYKDQLFVYTRTLLANLKSKGYILFAISGSQEEIVQKLSEYHGFDDYVAAKLEIKNGTYTGKIISPIRAKDAVLADLVTKHGASYDGSIAVGDSTSDIPMLLAVETPIAFNPELALYNHAVNKGWKIVVERKNVVYELTNQAGNYTVTT